MVSRPETLPQLEEAVRDALIEQRPLALFGAGSKAGFGRPVDARAGLSLAGLAGVDLYEPDELVMSAGAGEKLSLIEATLAEKGQVLAFEPLDYGALSGGPSGEATIGGVFATNAAGPRRLLAGSARDHLLGVNAVTGRGEAIKAGGRVMKNVTGYDIPKLLAGSFGTLAAISRVTFKTAPAPRDERTLLVASEDEPALFALLRAVSGSAATPSAAGLLPRDAAARSSIAALRDAGAAIALLRLEGETPSIDGRIATLAREGVFAACGEPASLGRDESAALWRAWRACSLVDRTASILWRISAPPSDAPRLAQDLDALGFSRLHDWAGGLIFASIHGEDAKADAVRALVAGGGHATLVRAPAALRRELSVFHEQAPTLAALTKRVKNSFDPMGVLNPGRLYGAF